MSIVTNESIEQVIERSVEKALSKHRDAVPLEHALWSTKEIGEYLQRPAQVVRERVVTVPGFPEAIRLPNFGGGKSHPRWRAIEVIQWVESHQGGKFGRPRRKD